MFKSILSFFDKEYLFNPNVYGVRFFEEKEDINASKKRLVSNIDLTPFKQRELTGSYNQTNINLDGFVFPLNCLFH